MKKYQIICSVIFLDLCQAKLTILRNDDGQKVHKQTHHLVMTTDHPECVIGKAKFAEFRPKWVFLSSQTPINACGCKYHTNVLLILEAVHWKFPDTFPL